MRTIAFLVGTSAAFLNGQPNLSWVELADTIYGIANTQDTFARYIQIRSGNIRRFDYYEGGGSNAFLAARDSVFLGSSNRIDSIIGYFRSNPNSSFIRSVRAVFDYPGTPSVHIQYYDLNNNPSNRVFAYGLTQLPYSILFSGDLIYLGDALPVGDVYPTSYLPGQLGDSLYSDTIDLSQQLAVVRRPRPGQCDTSIVYFGYGGNPLSPFFGGKICISNGRIDSLFLGAYDYWFYDNTGRPQRRITIDGIDVDTTDYYYDGAGRLIEVRKRGVSSGNSFTQRYILRYSGASSSLGSSVSKAGCLRWDPYQRHGRFECMAPDKVVEVAVHDLRGRQVWQAQIKGSESFSLPETLPAGLYFLRTAEAAGRIFLAP